MKDFFPAKLAHFGQPSKMSPKKAAYPDAHLKLNPAPSKQERHSFRPGMVPEQWKPQGCRATGRAVETGRLSVATGRRLVPASRRPVASSRRPDATPRGVGFFPCQPAPQQRAGSRTRRVRFLFRSGQGCDGLRDVNNLRTLSHLQQGSTFD